MENREIGNQHIVRRNDKNAYIRQFYTQNNSHPDKPTFSGA